MKRSARVFFGGGKYRVFSLIFFLLVLPLVFFSRTEIAFAQNAYPPNTNVDVDQNQHTQTQVVMIEIMAAMLCQLTGIDVFQPGKGCLGVDPITRKIGYIQPGNAPQLGGLLGLIINSTGTLYTPPASGIAYTKSLAQNFGIVKKANAQMAPGQEEYTGFTALQPLRYVWSVARNIIYFLFVIAFVIIGIMIMLRVKINPQTVMSIQNQIPKIIIAILLITFSYAIVGFLIDLMWVSTYFTINTLSPAITSTGESNAQTVQEIATANLYNNPLFYFNDLFDTPADSDRNVMGDMTVSIGQTIGIVVGKIAFAAIGINAESLGCNISISIWPPGLGEDSLGDCLGAGIYNALAFIVGILGGLIIAFALIIASIRIWFMLIKAYVYILMYTIIAPLYIFMGIFPGSTLGFTNWLRAITANLLVFPATIGMFLLARFFAVSNSPYNVQNDINLQYNPFLPPLIGNPSIQQNIGLLIAFGIVMIIPELLAILRDALKTQPNPRIAPAITKGLGAGIVPVSAGAGFFGGMLMRRGNKATGESMGVLRKWLIGNPNKFHEDGKMAPATTRFSRLRANTVGRVMGHEVHKS